MPLFNVVFPRTIKQHVLLHPILGHEICHATWTVKKSAVPLAQIAGALFVGTGLEDAVKFRAWLAATGLVTPAKLATVGNPELEKTRKSWCVEFICDLFGLLLMGPIPFGEPLVLHPGTLTLAPSLEWFKLPTNLKGVVTARSSWAREGLNIATATFVDPEYVGIITLELSNLGQVPIALYPGMRIAQVAFYTVSTSATPFPKRKARQFTMSFEPHAGFVTSKDEAFISSGIAP